MKSVFASVALVMAVTMSGCGKSPTTSKLTQVYKREIIDYQNACRDRDEQCRAIEELEKLDLALPETERERAHTEIARLEEYRRQLNEDIEHQALRLAEAQTAWVHAKDKK
jgi:hypothetical protein